MNAHPMPLRYGSTPRHETTHRQPVRRLLAGLLLAFAALVAAGVATAADTVKVTVEVDHSILPADTPGRAILKVNLDTGEMTALPADRAPVNICVVLDRSGSMTGDKIARAREAAITALHHLRPNDWFSLVIYGDHVQTLVPAQQVRDPEAIERQIALIKPGGGTALFAGVSQGAAELRKHVELDMVHRLILLSDGQANVGPQTPEDLGRLGAALIKEGIGVSTVGIGLDYNEDLMTQLSQKSDGNSYFVKNADDLPRVFRAELGEVVTVVARKVQIEIELAPGMEALRIIGREGRIENGKVYLTLSQLYASQRKYALVEVATPARPAGATATIASVSVKFEDFANGNTVRTTAGKCEVAFAADPAKQEASVNQEVVSSYGLNEAATAKDRAVDLFDQGRRAEALQELQAQQKRLIELGARTQNAQVESQANDLNKVYQDLNARGLDNESRKLMRTDSYQMRNQQSSE